MASLTLQNGVGQIEYGAFSCCDLQSVTIPGSVRSIGDWAFDSCESLTSVIVQEGVTSIGDFAFSNCPKLASIKLPNSLTSIGDLVIVGSASSVVVECDDNSYACQYFLKEGYIDIENHNPSNNQPLQNPSDPFPAGKKITASGGVYVSLGKGQAASATVLNAVKVNGKMYKVTQINSKAFSGCSKLKKITVKAASLTKVGSKALKGIHKKATIKVPKAKLKVYQKLFRGKGQAKTVKIKK